TGMSKKNAAGTKKSTRASERRQRRKVPEKQRANLVRSSFEDASDGDELDRQDTALGSNVPTVVGVGASAGGLEAFSQLLEALPATANVAIVFVQHLSPQHQSALPSLLASKTPVPIVQVTEGLQIEPQHVYVIPPNVQMGITDGVLHLLPRPYDRSQFT